MIRATRRGLGGTGSSCRLGTPRCCSTRCSICRVTRYPSRSSSKFRQWGSKTPGHPEHGHTPGVEMTTGPLGQGVGNAVGMALGEAELEALFNRPGRRSTGQTYFICRDGDLMEGVSPRGGDHRGALRPAQTDRLLRRQPHHDRRGDRARRTRRTWRRDTRRTAGHVQRIRRAQPEARSRPSTERAMQSRTTLASSCAARTSRTAPRRSTIPRRRTASRSARPRWRRPRRRWGGTRTRSSSCRARSKALFAQRARVARQAAWHVGRRLPRLAPQTGKRAGELDAFLAKDIPADLRQAARGRPRQGRRHA